MPTRKTTRRKTTTTRRRRTTPAKPVRRRRATRKKTMLSELFNPKMAQAGGKAVLGGAIGGATAGIIEKMASNQTVQNQALITGGAGFLVATMLKQTHIGAGMGAVAIYKLMQDAGMLNENSDDMYLQAYDYAQNIESLPAVLNENGDEMYLQENDEMYLQEGGVYDVGYYPAGFGG